MPRSQVRTRNPSVSVTHIVLFFSTLLMRDTPPTSWSFLLTRMSAPITWTKERTIGLEHSSVHYILNLIFLSLCDLYADQHCQLCAAITLCNEYHVHPHTVWAHPQNYHACASKSNYKWLTDDSFYSMLWEYRYIGAHTHVKFWKVATAKHLITQSFLL